jgi:dTDP-4-amino-4,6-dideoxygalactose transaminase
MINVTKTYLPELEEYCSYLSKIWESGHVTNHGPFVNQLEEELKKYFQVKHVFCTCNGTIALQIAIKALELKGEVITTPFSYVATTSTIKWEGCEPRFVDIDPETLCIDPKQIVAAINSKTTGILPVHVYGYACDVEALQEIARKNSLRLLYDAAHSFGVKYKDRSILEFGDISVLSFHATKLFHTIEGGAIITQDDELAHKISYLRNFGHAGPEAFFGVGINGKMCELSAAMGLCILPKIPNLIDRREQISVIYDSYFLDCPHIRRPKSDNVSAYNYSYYPIIFESEEALLAVRNLLNQEDIYPRRYFYPPLNSLNYVQQVDMPIAESISKRILCLPMAFDLQDGQVHAIGELVMEGLRS